MSKIPDWIVKYDSANYQSGAGKAVRYLMDELTKHKVVIGELMETVDGNGEDISELIERAKTMSHE